MVFGRNFDFYVADGRVMVNRRGLLKSAFGTNSGLQWISRFGSLTFNQFGHEFPNDGMNEAGLVVTMMQLAAGQYVSDSRPSLSALQWIQYQLDCSGSVAEVIASDHLIRIQPDSAVPLHFLVADRMGRCAVIEILGGQMVCHTDSSLPVAALTNDTYDASLAYDAATTPARADHVSSLGRFVQAAAAVRNFAGLHVADPVSYAFATLANVSQSSGTPTQWSIVYDIAKRTAYFRTRPLQSIKQIRLDDLDFRPTAPLRMMDINTYAFGDVTPETIYSPEDNLAVLLSVYRQTPPLVSTSTSYLERRAAYPDSVRAAVLPSVAAHPVNVAVTPGGSATLNATATGDGTLNYQWRHNGADVPSATATSLILGSAQPADAGVYTVAVTNAVGTIESAGAIVALTNATKVTGSGLEVAADIHHVNGNDYDQVLLTGAAATIIADPGQVTRLSYIDLTDDIVQVEFSGPGSLTLTLENAAGPTTPVKYNQPTEYMRGHATLTIANATAATNVSVFTVGSLTAVNQTLFRNDVTYDGVADIALLSITSADGHFGGIRASNAEFSAARGLTGINAPGIQFAGPVNLHNISASDSATPVLLTGEIETGQIGVTGGDLAQPNGRAVLVGEAQRIAMIAGTTSHNVAQPAHANCARCLRNNEDVTAQLVLNPGG